VPGSTAAALWQSVGVKAIPRKAWSARVRAMRQRLDAIREADGDRRGADVDSDASVLSEGDPGAQAATEADEPQVVDPHPVSAPVRAIAEWSWRLIVIGAAGYFAVTYLWRLRVVVFPVIVALLLAAALGPLVMRLRRAGFGRGAAAGTVLAGFLLVVIGGLSIVGSQLGTGLSDVVDSAEEGIDQVRDWLQTGPFHVQQSQIDRWIEQAQQAVSDNSDRLTSGAVGAAAAAIEVVVGALLALFTLFFFLYDGDRIWTWLVHLFPHRTEHRIREAGRLAWGTLQGYVRGTLLVALVDGVFITVLLLILRVPLAVPLGMIVFFGAFVPVVGAFVSGTLGVLVALVTQGPVIALIVLGGIVAVQQLEGHVLQPLVMGRFVRIHPLAVVLAIAFGSLIAGILGAIIAVPVVAVTNVVLGYLLRGDRPRPGTQVARADSGGA